MEIKRKVSFVKKHQENGNSESESESDSESVTPHQPISSPSESVVPQARDQLKLILRDPGADSGDEEKSKQAEKYMA